MKTSISAALLMAVSATQASANVDAVKSCEATLAPPAKLILQTVMPKLKPDEDARKIFKETVVGMVQSGQIESSSARKSAREAAECLKNLNG